MKTILSFFGLVCFLIIFGVSSVSASHLAGGEITYRSLGGGVYQVTATIYRDCAGIALAVPTITYISTCGGYGNAVATLINGPTLITVPCGGGLTTCNGGTLTGIERYDYSITVNLSPCADWRFSISLAARNAAINPFCNPGSTNLYVDAHLDNLTNDHDSPVFNSNPLFFNCANQTEILDCSVNNICDSIVYSLIAAKTDSVTSVPYCSGADSINFISSVPSPSLDPNTGLLTIHPTNTEVGDYAVLVRDYRNGVLISTIERDALVYITICTNRLPQATGINGANQFSTIFAANKTSCFNIFSSDSDTLQSTKLAIVQAIQGATFDIDSSLNQTGTFCWQPLLSDTGSSCPHCFLVKVNDDFCPTNGVRTYLYCITVVDSGFILNVNNPDSKIFVTVSPNPFNKSATVVLHGFSPLLHPQFILFDALGRTVTNTVIEQNELTIDGTLLPSGIYFYSVREDDRMMVTGKMVVTE